MQYSLAVGIALLSLSLIAINHFVADISPFSLSPDFTRGAEYMRIKHLGTLNLKSQKIDGIAIGKLSGLAWEADSATLYAISDDGFLFRFKVKVDNGFLTQIKPISAVPLLNEENKPLADSTRKDAEGLAIIKANNGLPDDSTLLISFEHDTRVAAYTVDGKWLYDLALPSKLQRKEDYHQRNSSLESILVHPQYGVIVATELFMEKEAKQRRILYALNPELKGMRWQFMSLPNQDSAVTGIDVAPDGSIILLERSWPNPLGRLVIGVRRIKLAECQPYSPCPVEDLAIFDSDKGWMVDNYEGLSQYQGNQFFMVSDDNSGILQNTLLTLIEIKD
ncbi:MAG: esterase-like activity of phytase family protein [Thiotrichaceae bacterium]